VGLAAAFGVMAVCATASAQQPAATGQSQVTFTKHVAPILQKSCQSCHRPGSVAPMSLLTYEEARPWARSIKQKVVGRSMPPWYVDKSVGIQTFKDDRSLTDQEVATIAAWVDGGAPRGNPADMPPAPAFDNARYEWTLKDEMRRDPDLIVQIPEPFLVPGKISNWWIELDSDTGLTEDRYIRAFETKPSLSGFPVVHHASTSMFMEETPEQQEGLGEYALGKTGDIHPEGTGRLIRAGTKLRWNMHYSANPNREDTYDRTSIGFWFYPRGYVPKHKLTRQPVGGVTDLDFPPGENNVRTDGYTVLENNIRLTVFQPHMHNLGKRQCLEAIYKDGRVQTLNCINWDFGWHIAYNYTDESQPLLPKGTILHVISWHDNSKANKWAADPRNWVGWGNRSTDDMSFAHISWYTLSDEEFAQHLRQRQTATSNTNQQQP
jgi:hypothetical protein